jgi:hypothetical protein
MSIHRVILSFMLAACIGGQWMALQGVAWIGMAVTYSLQEKSITEGLSKTFDGEHPCPLCVAAKKGMDEDQSPANNPQKAKSATEMMTVSQLRIFPPTPERSGVTNCSQKPHDWQEPPLAPPPRWV